jgi:hypothetical protein
MPSLLNPFWSASASASALADYIIEAAGPWTDAADTWTETVSLTVAAGKQVANKEYLVFWHCECDNVLGSLTSVRILEDAVEQYLSVEGGGASDASPMGFYKFTAAATPVDVTFSMEMKRGSASGTAEVRNAAIFVMGLTANDEYSATAGPSSAINSTSFSTVASLTFTPPSSGDYLIMASWREDPTSTNSRPDARLNHTSGNNVAIYRSRTWSTSQEMQHFMVWRLNSLSGSNTVNLQAANPFGGSFTHTLKDMHIAALRVSDFDAVEYDGTTASGIINSATYVDQDSITFTPAAVAHATFGYMFNDTNNGDTVTSKLDDGGSAIHELATATQASEATGAHQQYFNWDEYAASSRTIKTARKSGGAGTDLRVGGSALAVVNLNGRYS